jgi:hypothetical protein
MNSRNMYSQAMYKVLMLPFVFGVENIKYKLVNSAVVWFDKYSNQRILIGPRRKDKMLSS